jgi:hypothetical protein
MRRILLLSILAAGFLPASLRADALLTVDPADGFLNLFPGDTSGWGFHVVDRGGFMVLTSSFFIPDSPFGNYTDSFRCRRISMLFRLFPLWMCLSTPPVSRGWVNSTYSRPPPPARRSTVPFFFSTISISKIPGSTPRCQGEGLS